MAQTEWESLKIHPIFFLLQTPNPKVKILLVTITQVCQYSFSKPVKGTQPMLWRCCPLGVAVWCHLTQHILQTRQHSLLQNKVIASKIRNTIEIKVPAQVSKSPCWQVSLRWSTLKNTHPRVPHRRHARYTRLNQRQTKKNQSFLCTSTLQSLERKKQ